MSLEQKIKAELNKSNAEAGSNTPDYILARYLIACLNAFDDGVKERNRWASMEAHKPKINGDLFDN